MRWDTRTPLQKAGAGAGRGLQDLAQLMMMTQSRKQEQANLDRMFNSKQTAQTGKTIEGLGGPVGVGGPEYVTEKPMQTLNYPGYEPRGVSAPGSFGNAYNPAPADPMDDINLKKAQTDLEIAMEKLKQLRAGDKPKSDEDVRKDIFDEMYSPTTGMPTQGALDSAFTQRKTGLYPLGVPEEPGFLSNAWNSLTGLFGSDEAAPDKSTQPAILKPPNLPPNLEGMSYKPQMDENQAHAQGIMAEGYKVDDIDWDAFKKKYPTADVEAIKRYMGGKIR